MPQVGQHFTRAPLAKVAPGLRLVGLGRFPLPNLLFTALALLWGGCYAERFAAESRDPSARESISQKAVLDESDQAAVLRAFKELARGHQAVNAPSAAPQGVRWSDVFDAALFACDELEMAIVQTTTTSAGYDFQLKTVEGHTARLVVIRAPDPQVYQVEAEVGLYSDRLDRAMQLCAAFDRQMRAFGRKRKLPPPTASGH